MKALDKTEISVCFLVLGLALTSVTGTRERDLTIELANGTSCSRIYGGSSFPDVAQIFNIEPSQVIKLALTLSDVESVNRYFMGQLTNLKSLTLSGNYKLQKLGERLFVNNSRLVEINLNNNDIDTISLKTFDGVFQNGGLVGVLFLNDNNLRTFPPFITPAPGLKEIHLDDNPLIGVSREELRNLQQLKKISIRNANLLEIADYTFKDNPFIGDMDLSQNPGLVSISGLAFEGAKHLKFLNLSSTGISSVPYHGLENLEYLSLRESNNIWTIPSEIVQLPKLRYVEVPKAHRFLCCAFIYERKRVGHFGFGRGSNRTKNCTTNTPAPTRHVGTRAPWPTGQRPVATHTSGSRNTKRPAITGGFFMGRSAGRKLLWIDGFIRNNGTSTTPSRERTGSIGTRDGFGGGGGDDFGGGGFLKSTVAPRSVMFHCENITAPLSTFERTLVTCVPGPDALRPCDDIMGNTFLSIISWLVSLLALLSNAVVFAVLVLSRRRFTVTKFLITNLAFADMCLGLYLFVMICASTHTHGTYYNAVRSWQFGTGCKVAGFLAIFSSQLSMLVLTVITIERYLAIVYAVYLNKRLHMRNARILCIGSWLASALMALLPLVGVNSYSQVALCLPFETKSVVDLSYIAFILTFNTILFAVVFLAYFRMYWVVRSPKTDYSCDSRNDSAIAKRMALLVFTDFACWVPIAIIGLFSAAGYADSLGMDVKKSKYLLVIFFPINSICNPFLYALSTKSFRREVVLLLASCGICEKLSHEYTGGSFSRRSRHAKDIRQSETQSTFVVSRKDSRIDSLLTFFRRTVLSEKVPACTQSSPKVPERKNMYPMSSYQERDRTSPDMNFSPASESVFAYSKDGPASGNQQPNGCQGPANGSNTVNGLSSDEADRAFMITPSGHLSTPNASYTRSESATSNTSELSAFHDEAFLIKDKSTDCSAPKKNGLKDFRF